jgi:phosphatidylglycerol:prolipoprotein diacylglycerol transferase
MLGIGIVLALYLAEKRCEEFGVKRKFLIDLLIFTLIPGVIFARVFYLTFTEPSFLSNPLSFLIFLGSGFSIHGAILGGTIGIFIFSKQRNVSFLKTIDLISLFLPLAQSVGRIGCFLNGDSYGTITSVPWGVKFPGLLGKRHPTQIYETILDFLLFLFLYTLYQRGTFKKDGIIFLYYLIGYSFIRFLVEFFRESIFLGPLKIAQWASLLLISLLLFLLHYKNVYKEFS